MLKAFTLFIFLIFCYGFDGLAQINKTAQNINDKDGLKQGLWVHNYHNTEPAYFDKGSYRDDKKKGDWWSYYLDSIPKQYAQYKNGVLHGSYRTYRRNGELHGSGKYVNGQLDGEFIGYDTLGNIMSKLTWDNGELINQVYYNPEAKPTGTLETVKGRQCVWVNGELIPVKNITTIENK